MTVTIINIASTVIFLKLFAQIKNHFYIYSDILQIFCKINNHEETVNQGKHIIFRGGLYDSYLLAPVTLEG